MSEVMYLELAQKYLLKARSAPSGTRQYFANLCQVCLAKHGASPADIGTTQQELVALQAKSGKKTGTIIEVTSPKNDNHEICIKFLNQCREAQGASRQYYANLCLTKLAQYGFSPEDIGTTQDELLNLQSKGLLECAIKYLEQARGIDGARRKCYIDLCRDYLAKAKARPEDIGTSEQELINMAN